MNNLFQLELMVRFAHAEDPVYFSTDSDTDSAVGSDVDVMDVDISAIKVYS